MHMFTAVHRLRKEQVRKPTDQSVKLKNSFFIKEAVKCTSSVPFLTRVVPLENWNNELTSDTSLIKLGTI